MPEQTNTPTPLDEEFETLVAEGNFEDEQEKARPKPVPDGEYKLEIIDYNLKKTGPKSKNPGSPMVRFKTHIVDDSNPEYNGKTVFTQNYMLTGGGYSFFLNFLDSLNHKFSKGQPMVESTKERHQKGKGPGSEFLDSMIGIQFIASLTEGMQQEWDEDTGSYSGPEVPSGFNEIVTIKELA